jgi:hypothetical protein
MSQMRQESLQRAEKTLCSLWLWRIHENQALLVAKQEN